MSTIVQVPLQHRHTYNLKGVPIWYQWCRDTFGPENDSAYGRPAQQHYWRLLGPGWNLWFADPARATWFALRWS